MMININTWLSILVLLFLCSIDSNSVSISYIYHYLHHSSRPNYLFSGHNDLITDFSILCLYQLWFTLNTVSIFTTAQLRSSHIFSTLSSTHNHKLPMLCSGHRPAFCLASLLTIYPYMQESVLMQCYFPSVSFGICYYLAYLAFLLPYPSTWKSCPPHQSLLKYQFLHVAFFNSHSDTNVTTPFFEMPQHTLCIPYMTLSMSRLGLRAGLKQDCLYFGPGFAPN